MRSKIVVFILVVLFLGAYSFGDPIVLDTNDAETGFIRSNEASGEQDSLRIGGGESEGRTFVNILSFDTSSLSGKTVSQAWVRLTLNENNPIWGGDGQIAIGEEGWVNPDNEGPWMDMAAAFNGNTAFETDRGEDDEEYDNDASCGADLYGVHLDAEWGFADLTYEGPGNVLLIYLNAAALTFLSNHDKVQIRIGTTDGPGSGDAWDYSALDFYDGDHDGDDTAALVVIPEPATMLLLGLGGLLLRRRK